MVDIKNGETVTILNTGIKAIVVGVCIRGIENYTIEYNVQWMNGDSLSDIWLYDYNVKRFVDNSRPAGMVNYETGIVKK